MSMWEPFTERARRSIVLAREEAQRLGNNYTGTEHILLGIISDGETFAANMLGTLGVNLVKARREVAMIAGRGGRTARQEMVFTWRAKRVMDLASDEARRLNHNYTGTDHLLLELVRDRVAARMLANLGVDPAEVRIILLFDTERRVRPARHRHWQDPEMPVPSVARDDWAARRAVTWGATAAPPADSVGWSARLSHWLDSVPPLVGRLERAVLRIAGAELTVQLAWALIRPHT